MHISGRKRKKRKRKREGGGGIKLIYVLDSHKCGGIKSIVSLKYSVRPMA